MGILSSHKSKEATAEELEAAKQRLLSGEALNRYMNGNMNRMMKLFIDKRGGADYIKNKMYDAATSDMTQNHIQSTLKLSGQELWDAAKYGEANARQAAISNVDDVYAKIMQASRVKKRPIFSTFGGESTQKLGD